jgi:uncharacterized protein (DUF1919 family)
MKRTILVIILLAILARLTLFLIVDAKRTEHLLNKAEIRAYKDTIVMMKNKVDSLDSQVMARQILIERQNKNIQELSTKNRKLQIDYEKRIKAVDNLNAAGQLDLFTELVNN